MSHSARSAWIETAKGVISSDTLLSHSARSAWIETFSVTSPCLDTSVALRKECVD